MEMENENGNQCAINPIELDEKYRDSFQTKLKSNLFAELV